MSSSPPTETPRGRLAGVSLRTRLVAAIMALIAVICVVIGVVTTVLMRERLVGQLDAQLVSAARRTGAVPPGPLGPTPGGEHGPPGQGPGTITGYWDEDGDLDATVIAAANGGRNALTPAQTAALTAVPPDGRIHHVDVDGLGEYHVVVIQSERGGPVLTGLPLADVNGAVTTLIVVEISVAVGALLVGGGASWALVSLNLRPLRRVAATASRVAELPLAQGEVDLSVRVPTVDTDPRTEVGQVGAALNRMLGHVGDALAARHDSETRVRRFVADASHELRTPLAAIRGYAELTRRSRDEVPRDVAHALERVEAASARMTVLVNDLLLLARLDSGRPLVREPVDLSMLAVDALTDAHAAGPDHRWLLDLPDEAVVVTGDASRLHQVVANLLANARIHTPPGTTVQTRLSTENGWAVFEVLDDGPGIPAALQPEVFERFARGDNSRSRAAGSTGLGLAIVAAVVEAHGGETEVTSRPGRTSFVVRLPRDVEQ